AACNPDRAANDNARITAITTDKRAVFFISVYSHPAFGQYFRTLLSIEQTAGGNNSTRVLSPLYPGVRYLRALLSLQPSREHQRAEARCARSLSPKPVANVVSDLLLEHRLWMPSLTCCFFAFLGDMLKALHHVDGEGEAAGFSASDHATRNLLWNAKPRMVSIVRLESNWVSRSPAPPGSAVHSPH